MTNLFVDPDLVDTNDPVAQQLEQLYDKVVDRRLFSVFDLDRLYNVIAFRATSEAIAATPPEALAADIEELLRDIPDPLLFPMTADGSIDYLKIADMVHRIARNLNAG